MLENEGTYTIEEQKEAVSMHRQEEESAEIDEPTSSNFDAEIERLAELSKLEYERERRAVAKRLNIRTAVLDETVEQQRRAVDAPDDTSLTGDPIEPHSEPVDGVELLDQLTSIIRRCAILPSGAAETIALWILSTYVYNAFTIMPFLAIVSPTMRCGKTTVLNMLLHLCHSAISCANITLAALFRTVEHLRPTLLIDEADTSLFNTEEMKGLLNSGHNKATSFIFRIDPRTLLPAKFSTWCPKAIAMIGDLPETISDRSIIVTIRRKLSTEIVETFNPNDPTVRELSQKCHRWARDNRDTLRDITPERVQGLNDRAQDNWSPLLAIASLAGGSWPEKVAAATQSLPSSPAEAEEPDYIQVLSDIKRIFREAQAERLPTRVLLTKLHEIEDRPWAERRLNGRGLANMLRKFQIRPTTYREVEETCKGYRACDFNDAFGRYLT